jgi:hypothetical protein
LSYSCCPQCPQYFLFNGDFYKEEEVEERIVKIKVSMRFYWGHWGHPTRHCKYWVHDEKN